MKNNLEKRTKRKKRARSKLTVSDKRPRLSVFRSNRHIYVQIVNDKLGKTLISASDEELTKEGNNSKTKENKVKRQDQAYQVGELVAKKALAKKIKDVVFDRGSNRYHGRVKALAEGARKGGLQF